MESSEHKTNTQENTGAPLQISDAIDRLLANPELLSSVASAIGVKAPKSADTEKVESEASEKNDADANAKEASKAETPSKLPDIMTNAAPILAALSGGSLGGKLPDDDRTKLLCALKPYVNPHRQEAIDTIVNLARISEVIKTIK